MGDPLGRGRGLLPLRYLLVLRWWLPRVPQGPATALDLRLCPWVSRPCWGGEEERAGQRVLGSGCSFSLHCPRSLCWILAEPHHPVLGEGCPYRAECVAPQLAMVWQSILPGGDSPGQCPLSGCLAPRAAGGFQHPAGSPANPCSLQASQLGVYKAFVDNYKIALETAEKCSQSNYQFQKISEVSWTRAVLRGQGCHGWAVPVQDREHHPHGQADRVCPTEMLSQTGDSQGLSQRQSHQWLCWRVVVSECCGVCPPPHASSGWAQPSLPSFLGCRGSLRPLAPSSERGCWVLGTCGSFLLVASPCLAPL